MPKDQINNPENESAGKLNPKTKPKMAEAEIKRKAELMGANAIQRSKLLKEDENYLKNLEKESPEAAHKKLLEIAADRLRNKTLLDNFNKIKDLPYIDELLEAATNASTYLILRYPKIFGEKAFARPLLAELAKREFLSLKKIRPTAPQERSIDSFVRLSNLKGFEEWSAEGIPNIPEVIAIRTLLINKITVNDPIKGLSLYGKYKNLPDTDLILKNSIKNILEKTHSKNKVIAAQVIEDVLKLKDVSGIPGVSELQKKCRDVLATDPQIKKLLPGWLYLDESTPSEKTPILKDPVKDRLKGYLDESLTLLKGYKESKTLTDKENYLNESLNSLNPKLRNQIKELNSRLGISLKLVSLRQMPFEFIFVNTWENPKDKTHLPVRIALNLDEMKSANAIKIIERQYRKEATSKQADLWRRRGFGFDIPDNGKASFMIVAVPQAPGEQTVQGTEESMARIADIYRTQYGAKWEGALMQDSKAWKSALAKGKLLNTPDNIEPTKENILNNFRNNLIKAIDSGQVMFLFQYIMHGAPNTGAMLAAGRGMISAEEYALILSEIYNGKPLAAQINVTLIIESCFGGGQLDKIIDYLQTKKVKVKGLSVISGSQREATYKTYDPKGITSSLSLGSNLNTPINNYLNYYFGWIKQRRESGETIKPPVGTMGHALAFADAMQKGDSDYFTQTMRLTHPEVPDNSEFVDLQAYYYSTEKPIRNPEQASPASVKKKKGGPSGYYFSKRDLKEGSERAV